jgi:thiosulfate reductase cytochrome b subunit
MAFVIAFVIMATTAPLAPISSADPLETEAAVPARVYRHRWPTRLWHWINAVAMIVLFMSGLMIFNAHPRLYWGQYGANPDHAWLEINGREGPGYLRIGDTRVTTDGVLGRSTDANGEMQVRAFPHWITLPGPYDLAGARHFHLFAALWFAFGFMFFFIWSVFSKHAHRDISPRLKELGPRHLLHEIVDHARLRFPTGLAAAQFNSLQKIAYFVVLFILIPGIIFSGLAMSPGMNAIAPWTVDMFGGRASARSFHFIFCWALFGFFVIHIAMVVLAGPINEVRSMITGWFTLPKAKAAPMPASEGDAA